MRGEQDKSLKTSFKMDQFCLRPDCFIQTTKKETIQGGFAKWEFSAGADGKLIIKQEQKTVLLRGVLNYFLYLWLYLWLQYFIFTFHRYFFFCICVNLGNSSAGPLLQWLDWWCWSEASHTDWSPPSRADKPIWCLIVAWCKRFKAVTSNATSRQLNEATTDQWCIHTLMNVIWKNCFTQVLQFMSANEKKIHLWGQKQNTVQSDEGNRGAQLFQDVSHWQCSSLLLRVLYSLFFF